MDLINAKLPFTYTSIEVCRAFSQVWIHHLYHNQIHRKSLSKHSPRQPYCLNPSGSLHLKIFDSWASQSWQGLDVIGHIWDTWSSLKRILGPANTASFFFPSLQYKNAVTFLLQLVSLSGFFCGRKTSKEVFFLSKCMSSNAFDPSLFSTVKGSSLMPRWYALLQSSHRKMVVWIWWTYVLKTCQYFQLFFEEKSRSDGCSISHTYLQ